MGHKQTVLSGNGKESAFSHKQILNYSPICNCHSLGYAPIIFLLGTSRILLRLEDIVLALEKLLMGQPTEINMTLKQALIAVVISISFVTPAAAQDVNPLRPFGIELGAPFPDNVTYRDRDEGWGVIVYNFVNVPEPHTYFRQRWPRNPYSVHVSVATGEVIFVYAMSATGEHGVGRYGTPDTTCEQARALHDQIRDDFGWISIPKPGRPAGWYGIDNGTYWEGNLVDIIDQNPNDGIVNGVEIWVQCAMATWQVNIQFTDLGAYLRHNAAN